METIENKTSIEYIANSIYRRVTIERGELTFNQVFLALIGSEKPITLTEEELIEYTELSKILSEFVTTMYWAENSFFDLYESILYGLKMYAIGEK